MTYCFQADGPAVGPAGGPAGGSFDFLVRKRYKENKNLSVDGLNNQTPRQQPGFSPPLPPKQS